MQIDAMFASVTLRELRMISILSATVIVLILFSITSFAADTSGPRVFDPPRVPDDARLGKPRDYDTTTTFPLKFSSREEWERRAHEVREQILVAIGLWPMPPKEPLKPVIHGKIDRDDYTIEKVYFASLPGHYVTGNLYRPKK